MKLHLITILFYLSTLSRGTYYEGLARVYDYNDTYKHLWFECVDENNLMEFNEKRPSAANYCAIASQEQYELESTEEGSSVKNVDVKKIMLFSELCDECIIVPANINST